MKREKRYMTEAQREKRLARIGRIIKISLTASVVLFLAVFFAFVPFRLMLPVYPIAPREEGELRLHFLDLEGGVSIVEFPDGETLVVNAGSGSYDGDNTLCRYLRSLDITSLSLVATDCDSSHIGGMPALFETFQIDKTYLPAFGSDSGAWQRFMTALDEEDCEREKLARYSVIANASGAYTVCLSPYSTEEEEATADDASAVLYLSYAGVRAMLSGNVTQKREKRLAKEYATLGSIFDYGEYRVRLEEIDLFLAPSHGSDAGSSAEWLSLLSPAVSIVPCNRLERPSESAMERIVAHSSKVCRTDELGVVTVTVKDGAYTVTPHVLG